MHSARGGKEPRRVPSHGDRRIFLGRRPPPRSRRHRTEAHPGEVRNLTFSRSNTVIIGDSLEDVRTGLEGGAPVIGVASGKTPPPPNSPRPEPTWSSTTS
ncbi:HAD hydrolase-like protein [Streptomyces sp. NPDC001020]